MPNHGAPIERGSEGHILGTSVIIEKLNNNVKDLIPEDEMGHMNQEIIFHPQRSSHLYTHFLHFLSNSPNPRLRLVGRKTFSM